MERSGLESLARAQALRTACPRARPKSIKYTRPSSSATA